MNKLKKKISRYFANVFEIRTVGCRVGEIAQDFNTQ